MLIVTFSRFQTPLHIIIDIAAAVPVAAALLLLLPPPLTLHCHCN